MTKTTEGALDAFFDAWDKDTGEGRDAVAARQHCHDYVKANPEKFADLQALEDGKTPEEIRDALVAMVDERREAARLFRASGMEDQAVVVDSDKLRIDVWIMHRIEPQRIDGDFSMKVKLYQAGA